MGSKMQLRIKNIILFILNYLTFAYCTEWQKVTIRIKYPSIKHQMVTVASRLQPSGLRATLHVPLHHILSHLHQHSPTAEIPFKNYLNTFLMASDTPHG